MWKQQQNWRPFPYENHRFSASTLVYPWLTNTSIVSKGSRSSKDQFHEFLPWWGAGFPVFCSNLWISLDKSFLARAFGWSWCDHVVICNETYEIGKQTNPTRDIDNPKLKNMFGHTVFGQRSNCVRARIA